MEHRFRHRGIHLPLRKTEFDLYAAALPDDQARQFAGLAANLEEHDIVLAALRRRGVIGGGAVGIGGRPAHPASKQDVCFAFGLFLFGEIHARTNAGDFHLASQQRQRSSPVAALFRGNAHDGVIARDVKPGVFTVHQEDVFFRGFVFPAHFAGAAEIGGAGFGAHDPGVVFVFFEESRL